jgi:hypothetical protein
MKTLLAIIIILIVAGFYWFGWRPSQIVKNCNIEAKEKATRFLKGSNPKTEGPFDGILDLAIPEIQDTYYEECVREHGLVK